MTTLEAIRSLLREQRSTRLSSTAGADRILAACRTLGIVQRDEQILLLNDLDYCNILGNPYNSAVKPMWNAK